MTRNDIKTMPRALRSRIAFAMLAVGGAMLFACGCGSEDRSVRSEPPQEERVFAMLDEYGTWIDVADLGAVWRPRVSPDWRPYAYGHWEWSDQGWVWIGYEPFAWVVYHYGSWFDDREYGWIWVPSYDWSPARVSWIAADDYTCWAPLPPPGRTVPQPGDPYWAQTWVVVPSGEFTSENVIGYNVQQDARSLGRVRVGVQRPPDVREVAKTGEAGGQPAKVVTDRIQSGGRGLLRLRVSAQDERKVQAHDADVQELINRRTPVQGIQGGRDRQSEPGQGNPGSVVVPSNPSPSTPNPVALPARTRQGATTTQPSPSQTTAPEKKASRGTKAVRKRTGRDRTGGAEKQVKVKKETAPKQEEAKDKAK